MSDPPDPDVHALLLRHLDGDLSPDETAALNDALRDSPELRRQAAELLVQQTHLHELAATPETADAPTPLPWLRPLLATAAVLAAAFFLTTKLLDSPGGIAVTVVAAEQTTTAYTPGQTVHLDVLHLASGTLTFTPSDGVTVTAVAPATIEFLDPMRLRVPQGQVTAHVLPPGIGFTVETPHAEVVDLGTRFGVDVDGGGSSDVVVFEGEVDVHRDPGAAVTGPATNLKAGQAARFTTGGLHTPIASVRLTVTSADPGTGGTTWSTRDAPDGATVTAVADNRTDRFSYRFYPVLTASLQPGTHAWPYDGPGQNRPRWWGSAPGGDLPAELAGADLVQTLQQELDNPDLEITADLASPATVYVFYERNAPTPGWLTATFEKTGHTLTLSPTAPGAAGHTPYATFDVWRTSHDDPAAPLVLGAVPKTDKDTPPFYLYGLAARPGTP